MVSFHLKPLTKVGIIVGIVTIAAVGAAVAWIEMPRNDCVTETTDAKVVLAPMKISNSDDWKVIIAQVRPYLCKTLYVDKISFSLFNRSGDLMAEWPAPVKYNTDWLYKPTKCISPLISCDLIDANKNMTLDAGDYFYLSFEKGSSGIGWEMHALHDGSGVGSTVLT